MARRAARRRLPALLNALSDSCPSERAMAPTGSPRGRLRPATRIRERLRHSIASPANCPHPDTPISRAGAATVRRRSGSRRVAAIAAPTGLSESANSQHTLALVDVEAKRLDEDHPGELLGGQEASRLEKRMGFADRLC
jgi:hypothetical protein